MMKKTLLIAAFASIAALEQACFHSSHEVEVKPVEIKPMHITIDVNVKVEKQLADFFEDIDKHAEEISSQKKTAVAPPAISTTHPTQIPASTSIQTNDKN